MWQLTSFIAEMLKSCKHIIYWHNDNFIYKKTILSAMSRYQSTCSNLEINKSVSWRQEPTQYPNPTLLHALKIFSKGYIT